VINLEEDAATEPRSLPFERIEQMSAYPTPKLAVKITTLAGVQEVTQSEARSASALASLQEMADQLRSLKSRLELAMDSIAIAAGAWHCQECGQWTTRAIPHEDTLYCLTCLPPGADCPF
jgi:hypothetical protein